MKRSRFTETQIISILSEVDAGLSVEEVSRKHGMKIERIQPGHPQQNGRHERMHLTLKQDATQPPSYNFLQQQERFDQFIEVYNHERPHQALEGRYPGDRLHLQPVLISLQ